MTALSGERIQEIRSRLASITPGQWAIDEDTMSVWQLASGGTICDINADHQTGDHQPRGDVEMIANAPSDIADLLAECERLRALHREDTPEAWNVAGRPWALSVILAHIGNDEVTRIARALSVEDIDRFGAVIAGFQQQMRDQGNLAARAEGGSNG